MAWVDRSWVFDASYGFIGANFKDEIGFVPRAGIARRQALLGRHFRPRRLARWLRDLFPVAGITDVRRESGGFHSRYGEYRLLVTLQDGPRWRLARIPTTRIC